MTNISNQVPSQGLPLVDSNTGLMNPVWYRFFSSFIKNALVSISGTGYIVNTVSGIVARDISAGSNKVIINNGDAQNSNTSIDIDSTQLNLPESQIIGLVGNLTTINNNITTINNTLGNVTSGTYTPLLTNTTNVSSSSANTCQYLQVNKVVTVSGSVTMTATNNTTLTTLKISLPIASTLSQTYQLAGTCNANTIFQSGTLFADTSNNIATLQFISTSTSSNTVSFIFTYLIS